MKKSISKRKNTFRSGRTKNNRTMRKRKNKTVKRKNNISRKNKKISGGDGYSITFDLINDKESLTLKEKVLEEISKRGGKEEEFDTIVRDLPLNEENEPQEFTVDQFKDLENAKNGRYNITIVKNNLGTRYDFGFTAESKQSLHSIRLLNVDENTLQELFKKALIKFIKEELQEEPFGFGDENDIPSKFNEQINQSRMNFFNIHLNPNKTTNTIINDIKTFLNGLNPTDLQN